MKKPDSKLGMSGELLTRRVHTPDPRAAYSLKTPFGRMIFTKDRGEALTLGKDVLVSSLQVVHTGRTGVIKDIIDLGSGLVTNAGVNMMANDFSWTNATLKQQNYHGIGTGATAAAASDVVLQTAVGAGSLTGSTNGYMTGTQTLVAPNIYQTVATFTFSASVAVTEWALFNSNAAAVSIPATGTTYSATGATFTALGAAPTTGWTIVNLATAANTPTTTPMGLVTASSTTTVTIPGWYTLANAAAGTPTNATASQVVPTAFDHKVFSVINVVSGDTLQIQYRLTVTAGG